MSYIEKRVTAGRVKEGMKYHTVRHNSPKRPRAKNTNKTTARQAKINEDHSREKLYLLICANFKANDYYITLTHGNKKPEPEEAKKSLKKFIYKLRKLYKKAGEILKYIAVTEHKKCRVHHHLLINQIGIGINHIKKFWEHGFPKIQVYVGEPEDAERVANYLIKESNNTFNTPDKIHGLRWTSSKNLIQPKEEKKVVHASSWREDPKPPKGYYVVFVRRGFTEAGYPYQHYRMIKIPGGDEVEVHSG